MREHHPRGYCGNPGICLIRAQGKNSLKGLPRATHCTDRAQTSGNMTPTVKLCPRPLTFRKKVRARIDVSEEKKNENYTYTYIAAAAAGAGAETADGPSRNCGTAAVVSKAAAVWQGGGGTHAGSASSRPQTLHFLFLETYSQETPTAATAAAQHYTTQKKDDFLN